jgi:chaperonin GroES
MATATKSKDKTTVKLQPIGDRLVVKREESEGKTAGGIVLPDSAKDKPTRGVVVSIGDGRLLNDGKRAPLQVKVGDRVLFTSYAGENIEIGDEEFVLMSEGEVLAVLG